MLAVKEVLEKDLKNRMAVSFVNGEKRGEKRGIIEGKIQDAKNMLQENIDIDVIERVTGLKREEFI